MKNKKTLLLVLGALTLAGCNFTSNSTSSNKGSAPATSSSTKPSEGTSESSKDSSSNQNSSTGGTEINHIDPLVREIENPSKTRNYNENYDVMLDDFSNEQLGTNENAEKVNNHLRVLVDSNDNTNEGFFPNSDDKAIYKMATGSYEIETYDGIGFRMRKVGEGTLDYSNLVLSLRGNDAWKTYPITLSNALDVDMEALPTLTEEYQDIIISPNSTIEDDTTEYELKDGGASGTMVLNEILGFHLYAQGECAQMIEIEEVFLVKAGEKTTLDNFNRTQVNKTDDTCWWRDSQGLIVREGVKLDEGASYTVDATLEDYENVVLNVLGDTTGTVITPITSAGKGTGIGWASFKDADDAQVSSAVNGAYYPLAVNLEKSSIVTTDLVGFEISSTSEIYLSEVFLTNFKEKEAATEYPRIDTANASMFDNFNRTQSGFNGDYDASSTNPVVTDAGLTYALSYNNGDKVSVANGCVTFDATSLGTSDYINFKEGNDNCYKGQQYLVLSVKLEDGATLNDFRFDVGNGVVYVNQMYSAAGLKLPTIGQTDYPYVTDDGYTWLVIDLKESGMTPNGYIDFYYSGTGKLLMDCAFYADAFHNYQRTELMAPTTIADLSGYNYVGYYNSTGYDLVEMTFTSTTEGQTLKSIRIQSPAGEHWFKDGKVVDVKGNDISGDTVIPEDGLTVLVDLAASGMEKGDTHVHSGGFDGSAGDITISVSGVKDELVETGTLAPATIADLSGYNYVGYVYTGGAKVLRITFTSTTEGQTLKSIRIQSPAGEHWFKDGKVIDVKGNVISGDTVIPEGGLTVDIDLAASGMALGDTHIHSGGFDGSAGDITISAKALSEKAYSDILKGLTQ